MGPGGRGSLPASLGPVLERPRGHPEGGRAPGEKGTLFTPLSLSVGSTFSRNRSVTVRVGGLSSAWLDRPRTQAAQSTSWAGLHGLHPLPAQGAGAQGLSVTGAPGQQLLYLSPGLHGTGVGWSPP